MALATIMLVDDETPFVEAMTKRLSRRDLKVKTAFSGGSPEQVKLNAGTKTWR
jgi:ActR/RegA family two-component response regulator